MAVDFVFCSDHEAAFTAAYKAGKGKGVADRLRFPRLGEKCPHAIVLVERNHSGVSARVDLSAPDEHARVERVVQDSMDTANGEIFPTNTLMLPGSQSPRTGMLHEVTE
ncbi:MAG TPA: hypothetical protein PK539_00775 [Candidatus Paceibacterota bacterium]|nr:hypothetical protein [Candidatus Paceibacterota bacterium]